MRDKIKGKARYLKRMARIKPMKHRVKKPFIFDGAKIREPVMSLDTMDHFDHVRYLDSLHRSDRNERRKEWQR